MIGLYAFKIAENNENVRVKYSSINNYKIQNSFYACMIQVCIVTAYMAAVFNILSHGRQFPNCRAVVFIGRQPAITREYKLLLRQHVLHLT